MQESCTNAGKVFCGCVENEELLLSNAQKLLDRLNVQNITHRNVTSLIEKFYRRYAVLMQLFTEKASTEEEHHPELHRVSAELERYERALFVALSPSLGRRAETYKRQLRSHVVELKALESLDPYAAVLDAVFVRDKIIQCNRDFISWFPGCLKPPVDTFPNEGMPLVNEKREQKRWFCIERMMLALPRQTQLIFESRRVTIFDLGVEIGYKAHALLLRLPSARFSEALPRTPDAPIEQPVRTKPECCICGEEKTTIVDTRKFAGHKTCSQRNAVCYDCFRSYAWSLQHNDSGEFLSPQPVLCPFCRYAFPLKRSEASWSYALDERVEIRRAKRRLRGGRQTE